MQLVLDDKGRQLTRGQRALRAYLNAEKPPLGFKGDPFIDSGRKTERDLTEFHLSRYIYVRTIIEGALHENFELQEEEKKGYYTKVKPVKITKEDIEKHRERVKGAMESAKKQRFKLVERKLREWLKITENIDEKIIERTEQLYNKMLFVYLRCIDWLSLEYSNPEKEARFIDNIRRNGKKLKLYEELLYNFSEGYMLFEKGQVELEDYVALIMLKIIAYSQAEQAVEKGRRGAGTNELGRAKFERRDRQMLQFVRKHLFNEGLSQGMILDAVRMAGMKPDQLWLDRLLKLHQKYSLKTDFSFNGWNFNLEASPFAEKWIGDPIGNFEMAIYPKDAVVQRELEAIADNTFEHADGAIALAAFTRINRRRLILEEIQSDVPHLMAKSWEETPELERLVAEWPKIVMNAVRIFARERGYKEFFAATPWRVLCRYRGTMHPDKARLYFDGMEKLGGTLVKDGEEIGYTGEFGLKQYYYRFEV